MKTTIKKEKTFDTVKVFLEIKEKIAKETEKMTFAEFKEYLNKNKLQTANKLCLRPTWGLAILGQDVLIFISSNMATVVRAGQTSVGFWLLSCTFVFQSASVPGLTFFNYPAISNTCSLAVTLVDHPFLKVPDL